MSRIARDKRPYVRPVKRVELSEQNEKRRIIAAVIGLFIACGALFFAINGMLTVEPGWLEIEATNASTVNCSRDFVVNYYVGGGDLTATKEKKALIAIYSDLAQYCYKVFDPIEEYDEVRNLAYVNHHINEEIEVDSLLYETFEKLDKYDARYMYLGPVYNHYNGVFFASSDVEAAAFDPEKDPVIQEEYQALSDFAKNPEMVNVELLGNNKLILHVADTYKTYCEDNAFSNYLDMYWMKNAFIIDHIADAFQEKGFLNGYITSFDGYVRNLDPTGQMDYGASIFDRKDMTIYNVGTIGYKSKSSSIVSFRSFPISGADKQFYYERLDGGVNNRYLSMEDGVQKNAATYLLAYAEDNTSCADMLLELAPYYITDANLIDEIPEMKKLGMDYVYLDGKKVISTSDKLGLIITHEEYAE